MNFNGNRSVSSKFMLYIEYSVITSDIIKSFDCIRNVVLKEVFDLIISLVNVLHTCL